MIVCAKGIYLSKNLPSSEFLSVGVSLIRAYLFIQQVALEWSTEKYAAVFNSFSDNIAGKSFRTRYNCIIQHQ